MVINLMNPALWDVVLRLTLGVTLSLSKCDNKKCECKKYCHQIKIIYSVAQTILSVLYLF